MQARYTIQTVDPDRRQQTGSADDIHSALNAAWALNRHTEGDVEIVENQEGTPHVIAVLSLEWRDGE
jgi:hypothetical protein